MGKAAKTATDREPDTAIERLKAEIEALTASNRALTARVESLTVLNDDLDNLIATIDIGTIFLDPDGRVRRFTPPATQSVAITDSDIGRRVYDLPLRVDYPAFPDDVLFVLNGGPAIVTETPAEGNRMMMVRIRPYRAGGTRRAGAVVSFMDITRPSAAERRLQVYINSLPHQVAVIAPDGTILLVNAAWQRFALDNGGRLDRVGVGTNYLAACDHAAESAPVAEGVRAVLRGEIDHFNWEYPCHGPRTARWFMMTVTPVEGGAGGAVITHINISERKQAEDQMRLAASVFDNSGEGIVITDPEERILSVNEAFRETTGFSPEDVVGRPARVILSAGLQSPVHRSSWRDLTATGVWRGEASNRHKRGKSFPVWLTISRVVDTEGRLRNLVAVFSDLSDRKESERRLLEINAELEQFAYVTSHDLREPLRMVASYLGLIERRMAGTVSTELKEYLDFAIDGARRMDHLILDLLEYSRIGRTSYPPQPVVLGGLIDRVLSILKVAIEESGAEIFVVGRDLTVEIDPDDGLRVLQNLVANAIKYCPPDRRPGISIACRSDGDMVSVAVSDNGIGIDEAQRDRIFRMFQRLHGRDEYGGGTGIGLAICKKSVERMGGTIRVDSTPGRGSTFTVTMPAAAP